MGDGFYRSKDPTNSIKLLKENLQKKITQRTKKTQNTHAYTQNSKTNTAYNYNTASPLVYNKMGWLGDSSHRGQGCQAWTAVGLPPWYPQLLATTTIHYIRHYKRQWHQLLYWESCTMHTAGSLTRITSVEKYTHDSQTLLMLVNTSIFSRSLSASLSLEHDLNAWNNQLSVTT